MKKQLNSLILILLSFTFLKSQQSTQLQDLFVIDQTIHDRTNDFVSNALFLTLRNDDFKNITRSMDESLNLKIPISSDKFVNLVLNRFEVFSDDFILRTSDGDTIRNYKPGLFYRGKIKDMDGIATISFFDDQLFGIISIKDVGNFNIGELKNEKGKYIIYNDRDVKISMGIDCKVDDGDYEIGDGRIHSNNIHQRTTCVKMYLEGDYSLFQDKGSITNTANYMTGLFAQMQSLFLAESINVEIKEIKIWTTADGYSTSSSSTALTQFVANNPNLNADLGHLFALGGSNTGGIAYVDVLCNNNYKYAYSNISSSYNNVPTYSWSVECITHETGHNLGSPHTHKCAWNGNNTQIDDCGSKYFYPNSAPPSTYEAYPCYDFNNPILPGLNNGTIMSYCHLLSGQGIGFDKGFGTQPGNLIRTKVNSASCLTSCSGSNTCGIPVNVTTGSVYSTYATLQWQAGATGSKWQVQYGPSGFTLGTGTIVSNITTTTYNLTGLNSGTAYDWYVRTDCNGGDYSSWVGKLSFETDCSLGFTTLPYFQGFENNSGTRQTNGTMYCDFDEKWYFQTDVQSRGRVRYGTNIPSSTYACTGSGSLLFDTYPSGTDAYNTATLDLDLSSYTSSHNLLFKFNFKDIGDEDNVEDKVEVRGNSSTWLTAYSIVPSTKINGPVYKVAIDLDSLLVTNSQNVSSTFQIKFGQKDNQATPNDGIAYDDIEIKDCGKLTIPYTNDFESGSECWSFFDTNNDAYKWTVKTGTKCSSKYMGLEYNGTTNPSVSMNDWLFSPGFYMLGNSHYELTFYEGDNGEGEKMEVYLSEDNDPTTASAGLMLFKDENLNNNTCSRSTIEFTAPSTGYYFIGFHGYSNSNTTHHLYIDDFSIKDAPGILGMVIENNSNNTCDQVSMVGVAGDQWHHIYNGSNHIIASINPNNNVLGEVTIDMRDGGSVESYNINGVNVKTIPRYFKISSDNTFSTPVKVRLYFLDAELNQYNSTPPVTSDIVSALQINHYSGSNQDCNFANNSGTGTIILSNNISSGNAGNNSGKYMEYSTPSFSEFLIHQAALTGLPMSASLAGNVISEVNYIEAYLFHNYFDENKIILQRKSRDGDWEEFHSFGAINRSTSKLTFTDYNPYGVTFYRLKIAGFDDLLQYSNIISLNNYTSNHDVSIYPNPFNQSFNININENNFNQLKVEVYNSLNEIIYSRSYDKSSLSNRSIEVDLNSNPNGIYIVKTFIDHKEPVITRIAKD